MAPGVVSSTPRAIAGVDVDQQAIAACDPARRMDDHRVAKRRVFRIQRLLYDERTEMLVADQRSALLASLEGERQPCVPVCHVRRCCRATLRSVRRASGEGARRERPASYRQQLADCIRFHLVAGAALNDLRRGSSPAYWPASAAAKS